VGRQRIEWNDTQLRLIMSGIESNDRQFPQDNARFLDAVIDEIRIVTGRLYGVSTYVRLLGVTAVTRRPGTTTIQKAIDRAQALKPGTLLDGEKSDATAFDVHTLRRAVEPVVRDALGPVHALLAQLLANKVVVWRRSRRDAGRRPDDSEIDPDRARRRARARAPPRGRQWTAKARTRPVGSAGVDCRDAHRTVARAVARGNCRVIDRCGGAGEGRRAAARDRTISEATKRFGASAGNRRSGRIAPACETASGARRPPASRQ
jgi:hypothetical protein